MILPGRDAVRSATYRAAQGLLLAAFASAVLAACGHGGLPKAFREGADASNVTFGAKQLHTKEAVWLAVPPLQLAIKEPIRITSVKVLGSPPISNVRAYTLSLSSNGQRAINVLEDRYFRSYGLRVDGPLSAAVYRFGAAPDYYPALKVHFTRPGHYILPGFDITYEDSHKRNGEQRITERFDLTVLP